MELRGDRVLGSDRPIAPYPPFGVMGGARQRPRSRDVTRDPHGPEQALTALRALRGMAVNAAHAAGEEHLAGRIALGHRADRTVLADGPLTATAAELPREQGARGVGAGPGRGPEGALDGACGVR